MSTRYRVRVGMPCALPGSTDRSCPPAPAFPAQDTQGRAGLQDQHLAHLLHRQKQNITQAALQEGTQKKKGFFSSAHSEMKRLSEKP